MAQADYIGTYGDTPSERDLMIESNMGLVGAAVRRFKDRGHDAEELFQVGCIGLVKAVDRFNASRGLAFSTYAVPLIAGEIKRFLRDDGMVRVARSLKEKGRAIARAREELEMQLGRDPTLAEVARKSGLSAEDVVMAMEANERPQSIYSTMTAGDGDGAVLIDMVCDSEMMGEEHIIDRIAVETLIEQLSDTERKLIEMRYFEGYTQRQTGDALGLSQVAISRLEKKILISMRENIC